MASKVIFGTSCTVNSLTLLPGVISYQCAPDSTGNLWIAGYFVSGNGYGVLPVATGTLFGTSVTANTVSLWPGSGTVPGSTSGYSLGLAVDSAGNIYVTDSGALRVLPVASGTLFGQSVTANTWHSLSTSSLLKNAVLTFDAAGNLWACTSGIGVAVFPLATGTLFGTSVTAHTAKTIVSDSGVTQQMSFDTAGNLYGGYGTTGYLWVLPVASGTLFGQSVTANSEYIWAPSGLGSATASGVQFDAAGNLYLAASTSLWVLPVASGKLFGTSVTANTCSELVSTTLSAGYGLAFDPAGDLFIADASNGIYVIAAALQSLTDIPQILPGPTWFDLFKPGMPRPRPLPDPQFIVTPITSSGGVTAAAASLSAAQALVLNPPADLPLKPGPQWLAHYKRIPPRPQQPAPPSGPYFGNLPNPSDIPQINPGPTWLDTFKPGMPRPRPSALPGGGLTMSGGVTAAAASISGTGIVNPGSTGGVTAAAPSISGTIHETNPYNQPEVQPGPQWVRHFKPGLAKPLPFVPDIGHPAAAGGVTAAAPSISGHGIVPVPTEPDLLPGPQWMRHFKPGRARPLPFVAAQQFIGARGGVTAAAASLAGSGIVATLFPQLVLPLKYELLLNGTWTDVTDYVYQRAPQVITRGEPNETSNIQASGLTLTINNRGGNFTPGNTAGNFYPFITRNVQLRVSVTGAVGSPTGTPYAGYRFWGEVSEWPPTWDPTGRDVSVQVVAAGVLRRYAQGAKIGSALRRYYAGLTDGRLPYAIWPCEDASGSTSIASMLSSVEPMTFTGTPDFASNTAFGGSDAIPVVNSSTWHGVTGSDADPPGTGSIAQVNPGTYHFTCPPGVSVIDVTELVGSGGGGGDTDGTTGGGGAGGAECAINTSVAVTGSTRYTYVVPPGGAAGAGGDGTAGSSATWAGDSHTATAHGGDGGLYAGSGGNGGTGSPDPAHYDGGTGADGEVSSSSWYSQTVYGYAGSTGGGAAGGQNSASWTAPAGISGDLYLKGAAGGGGGGGGGQNTDNSGGGGGGGGAASTSTSASAGDNFTFYAGDGGGGGGAPGNSGVIGGDGGGTSSSDGSINVDGGSAGTNGGNAEGLGGSGGSGDTPGDSGADGYFSGTYQGGYGGSSADAGGGYGGIYGGRTPETGGGAGGGGGGGAPAQYGAGGGGGWLQWSWLVVGSPAGGGGGSSGGTSSAGNAGIGSVGGSAVTDGGAGGDQGTAGDGPGGGGGGAVPAFGSNPAMAAGNGAAGKVAFNWDGGATSPVAADIVRFLLDIPAAGEVDGTVLVQFVTYSTQVATVDLVYHTGGNLELLGYNSSSSLVFDSGSQSFGAAGTPMMVDIQLISDGASIEWSLSAIEPGASSAIATYTGTVTGTVLYVSDVYVSPAAAVVDSAVGWVTVQTYADPLTTLAGVIGGYEGETGAARLSRLAAEEGITFALIGAAGDTPQMGPQQDDTLVNIFQSVADFDRGQLFEPRDSLGIAYRTRVNMQNQSPAVILDYSAAMLAPPVQPTADDQYTRNDITLTRQGGSSATGQQTTGTMSIYSPPLGVGDYTYSLTVYAYEDSQLPGAIAWMLLIGTVNELRYPQLTIDLARIEVASVFAACADLDVGDFAQITRPPAFLTSANIDQLAWGFTETLNAYMWTIAINAVPEDPYAGSGLPTW
jgi:hypothetical protein